MERRDKVILKRVWRRSPAKQAVVYRTLLANNTIHNAASAVRSISRISSRILHRRAKKTLFLSSTAYLRHSLRHLVYIQKSRKGAQVRKVRRTRRGISRLDAKLRLASSSVPVVSRAFRGALNQKRHPFARNILQRSNR